MSRSWNPNKVFDLSNSELKLIQERAAVRSKIKAEYTQKLTNPNRGVNGYIFDPAIQRFLSMRADHFYQFKTTPKSTAIGIAFMLPFGILWWSLRRENAKKERMIRSGQVAYTHRSWKYI